MIPVQVTVAQPCPILCDPVDCSSPGSSVHGILQARILEWVAIPFSRGSSWPRDRTRVSCLAGCFFTIWATGKSGLDLCLFLTQSHPWSLPALIQPYWTPWASFHLLFSPSWWSSASLFCLHPIPFSWITAIQPSDVSLNITSSRKPLVTLHPKAVGYALKGLHQSVSCIPPLPTGSLVSVPLMRLWAWEGQQSGCLAHSRCSWAFVEWISE